MASCRLSNSLLDDDYIRSSSYSGAATHAHGAHVHLHHHSHSEYLQDEIPFPLWIEVIILPVFCSVKAQMYFWQVEQIGNTSVVH